MLYDTKSNDLTQLQVLAATGLIQRSVDNEIMLTGQNLRLQNVVQALSEELARLRNEDVAGLNQQLSEMQNRLNSAISEREEVLIQFGTVKQRESTLKEELRSLRAETESLKTQLEEATPKTFTKKKSKG